MRVFLVAGLAYGDEGKGGMTDFLCRHHGARLVVRYNGGPQAAHNVVTEDGRHHTFSQFGSGSFIPGCRTHLSRYMLIEPYAMLNEATVWKLKNNGEPLLPRLTIDEGCTIITPWHWWANRIKELARGENRHGSCGMGIGEARSDELSGLKLTVRMLKDPESAVEELGEIRQRKIDEVANQGLYSAATREIYNAMVDENPYDVLNFYRKEWLSKVKVVNKRWLGQQEEDMVFEGAQGVLLDETYGFQPYTTWTACTFFNAFRLLSQIGYPIDPGLEVIRVGVIRSYMTRHGDGPFPTEYKHAFPPDKHNKFGDWQGDVRVGYLDLPMLRYALDCIGGVDYLAVTHIDAVRDSTVFCNSYVRGSQIERRVKSNDTGWLAGCRPVYIYTHDLIESIALELKTPVGYISWGEKSNAKVVRRCLERIRGAAQSQEDSPGRIIKVRGGDRNEEETGLSSIP